MIIFIVLPSQVLEDEYIIKNLYYVYIIAYYPFILLKLLFCEENEQKSKDFKKNFHKFTNDSFRLAISWNTRKIKSLFKLKDKNLYPAYLLWRVLLWEKLYRRNR